MMETAGAVFTFLSSPAGASILGALWLISEGLASIESLKSNSVFQLIRNGLARFKPADKA